MSPLLRVEIIALALIFIVLVFRTVNKKKLQMRYSLIWLVISFCLIVIAIFPQIVIGLSALVGIEVPSNLIYLLGIAVLLVIAFFHTVYLSAQADKIKNLVQKISINNYLQAEADYRLPADSNFDKEERADSSK